MNLIHTVSVCINCIDKFEKTCLIHIDILYAQIYSLYCSDMDAERPIQYDTIEQCDKSKRLDFGYEEDTVIKNLFYVIYIFACVFSNNIKVW